MSSWLLELDFPFHSSSLLNLSIMGQPKPICLWALCKIFEKICNFAISKFRKIVLTKPAQHDIIKLRYIVITKLFTGEQQWLPLRQERKAFMERDYGREIDALQKELSEIKNLLRQFAGKGSGRSGEGCRITGKTENAEEGTPSGEAGSSAELKKGCEPGIIEVIHDMHPDKLVSRQMEELCIQTDEQKVSGLISYMGVFASGGRQSNWIRHQIPTDGLLELLENHTAEKVLHCLGNSARLSILLALLQKPRTVSELVEVCGLNSTGQAYHHLRPLLAADIAAEDEASGNKGRGVYIVPPHKVQGIIMLLAGITDMVDETYTKGNWDSLEE